MTRSPRERAHLCLVHPRGEEHILALLDPLLYVEHALVEAGVAVSAAKNQLRRDAVNLVFGAHLGFDPALAREYDCVFVNLEQLGVGGKPVSPAYFDLLAHHPVIDYHELNVPAYAGADRQVPVISFGHAPYLSQAPRPLESRSIDLLFLGAMVPRRKLIVERLRAAGLDVVAPAEPLYGPERDAVIRDARAVLNVAAYDVSRFEQVRASLVLSLGTPVLSERRPLTVPGELAYEHLVDWFDPDQIDAGFADRFRSADWARSAERRVRAFAAHRPTASVVQAWTQLVGAPVQAGAPTEAPAAAAVALGAGRTDRSAGWLVLDVDPATQPDVLLTSWGAPAPSGDIVTAAGARVHLGSAARVRIADGGDVVTSSNLLRLAMGLLGEGGAAEVDLHPGADWSAVQAVLDRSWEAGLATHRFTLGESFAIDAAGDRCTESSGVAVRVVLRKVACSPFETTAARTMMDDFGGLLTRAP